MPHDPSSLEIVDRVDGAVTTRLTGDLDIVTSDQVKRDLTALLEDGAPHLRLDLSTVGFVDSSGLGVLVALHRLAESLGGSFVVQTVPPQVQRLFDITRLGDLLMVERR